MFYYKEIAREWDRLNTLSKEEASELDNSIEDGIFQAFNQFTFQLMNRLTETYPETKRLSHDEVEKIKKGVSNALLSGYLIYVAYQKVASLRRPRMRQGIQYSPTLMNEYNDIVAPYTPNNKSNAFNQLLDGEPAIELLFEKVSSIEMNILKKSYPHIDDIPFKIGYMVKDLLSRGVFMGFGLGYSENSLRSWNSSWQIFFFELKFLVILIF